MRKGLELNPHCPKCPVFQLLDQAQIGKQSVDSCTAIAEMRLVLFVCHGTFLSPAEFVQHSGRTDISHPERHIVVNPSPYANQDASAME